MKPFLGNALAIMLYAHAPRKACLLPTLNSVQLWRGRLKRDIMRQMARTGISMGYDGTLAALDRIRKDFDKGAMDCKHTLERQLSEGLVENRDIGHDVQADMEASFALADMMPNLEDEIEPNDDEEEDGNDYKINFKLALVL